MPYMDIRGVRSRYGTYLLVLSLLLAIVACSDSTEPTRFVNISGVYDLIYLNGEAILPPSDPNECELEWERISFSDEEADPSVAEGYLWGSRLDQPTVCTNSQYFCCSNQEYRATRDSILGQGGVLDGGAEWILFPTRFRFTDEGDVYVYNLLPNCETMTQCD